MVQSGSIHLAIPASAIVTEAATARQPEVRRTDLQRHDPSEPGHEAGHVLVDFHLGAMASKHKYYGEEIIYILEGTLEYHVDGMKHVTLEPRQVLSIPAAGPHSARKPGEKLGNELATYIVETGKPLVEPVN